MNATIGSRTSCPFQTKSLSRGTLLLPALLVTFFLGDCLRLAGAKELEFEPIFDGTTLSGWTQHGGKAMFSVEDGQIVGTAIPDTPNSFLCTNKPYANFVLELEFKVDYGINSGVQIRSGIYEAPTVVLTKASEGDIQEQKHPAGRVYGYQVEIDPSERAWSGGIYDEARRGWLQNLKKNKAAQEAFKQDEWNKLRIEAKGKSLKTWINDVPAAKLKDGAAAYGFIALQVHSIDSDPVGLNKKQVRWRNLNIHEFK